MELRVDVPPWARYVISDLTAMEHAPHPVDAARVTRFRLTLPDAVYFEYAFLDEAGDVRADPANPGRADNPWYAELSAAKGPDYAPHPLAAPDPELAQGRLRRLRLPTAHGGTRRATLYEPRGVDGPAPLLVAHDGTAYLRIAQLPAVYEALRSQGRVRAARMAFLDPHRPERRRAEYGFGADAEAYQQDLEGAFLPRLRELAHAAGGIYLLGASLGALAAARYAVARPDRVAGLALQSGAFLGAPEDPDPHESARSWFREALDRDPGALPWRVYQEVGTLDWLAEVNRAVATRLAERAEAHAFETRPAGHNWTFWRDGLAEALAFLLPPEDVPPAEGR
ncbi:MAG: alpha/beta hydrolase-fold protein [Trueperaceae bacterium]|nr:alpha/beta hydrolase-fold protein [Trueperaceae bacterium]